MKHDFYSETQSDPELEEVGTIRINVRIFGEYDNSTFTTISFAGDFMELQGECRSIQDLNNFLKEEGINEENILDLLTSLGLYIEEQISSPSNEYSPGCSLEVFIDIDPDDEDSENEEAVQASFDETSNIRFKPASHTAVNSIPTGTYKKTSSVSELCTVCLEELMDDAIVKTLRCGHTFDNDCIVHWLKISHVCPSCRFELPTEDQGTWLLQ